MTEAKMGDVVRINYTGRLTNGTQFDSSAGREPLEFTIGLGQVIKGLEAHVAGMEPGQKDTVTIPCADAYGPHRAEAIQTLDRAKVPSGIDLDAVVVHLDHRYRQHAAIAGARLQLRANLDVDTRG